MQGSNEFRFNLASMIEIVQHYFDTVLFKEPTLQVTSIDKGVVDHCPSFAVTVKPKTQDATN